MTHPKIVTR